MQAISGTETILVVDDEISVLSLAHAMLRRYGYTVIGANSAAEVLRLFQVWPDLEVDLALIDIVMSDMDGFELADRLRKTRPSLPVVYISAYSEKEDARPPATGDIPFLAKPFSPQQLAGKVRAVLDMSSRLSASSV
jgi:CheY-like chemotaxis protein